MSNIVYVGSIYRIEFAIQINGLMPARKFLEKIEKRERYKFDSLFRRLGDHGEIRNEEKFRKILGTIFWEFKTPKYRIVCYFRSDRRVVLAHGFQKPRGHKNEIRSEDKKRAKRIMEEYEETINQ